ncbi:MAG: TatD family hydrolase [Gemmatimonadales bacterium]
MCEVPRNCHRPQPQTESLTFCAVLVDTHCHLGDSKFDSDRDAVVNRARDVGVRHVIVVADCEATSRTAMTLARKYELSCTAGVHPHEASSWSDDVAHAIERMLNDSTVVAVGEAGLDYHYEHSPRDLQKVVLRQQLELAVRYELPIVIHSRSADSDMVAMLRDTDATAVLHSFSSGKELLRLGIERSDYVSFSGMVTFGSWNDDEAICAVPADRILIETDSPYLAPVPHRGRRNEPAFVVEVASRLAEVRETTVEEIAAQTTANAEECFGIHA